MQSISLVMSACFLSGRGQGHVSNFYIVDLENFATASRRYTGDTQLRLRLRMADPCTKFEVFSISRCADLHGVKKIL